MMKNSLFSTSLFLSLFFISPSITFADLRNEYSSQQQRSWSSAQYENSNGARIYVDKQGFYHVTTDGEYWIKGNGQVGYIKSEMGNTCYFGTTAACLNNIVETKTQISIEGNELVRYTQTGGGETSRFVIGRKIR